MPAAASHRKPRPLDASMTAEAALRLVAAECLAEFDVQITRMHARPDPEATHAARVELRRWRAALAGFAPIIAKDVLKAAKAEARALFRALGPLRDADVAAAAAVETAAAALQKQTTQAREAARTAMHALDAAGFRARTTAQFAAKGYRRTGRTARRWRRAPIRTLAARALQQAWQTCDAHGTKIARLPPAARHALRKDLKTLRYLSDFFAPLWPGAAQRAFARNIEALQTDLGTLNDMATMAQTATALPDEKREETALRAADAQGHKLRKAGPWWR